MRIRRGNVFFILTGEIQTGKTRWLQGVLGDLSACGVPLRGVVAPGVWTRVGRGFEKLGIDNVLLPSGEVVHLARRRDLARASGCLDACGQSESAGLGWAMADDALDRVDAHFVQLMKGDASPADVGCGDFALESSLLPGLTVVDELGRLELLRGRGLVHALELLDRVGLAEKAHSYPSQLSGGQQQRVAIARALACEPEVILCDEATSALDPKSTNTILKLLRDINQETGVTLVVITHSMDVVQKICKNVAVLDSGRVVETGEVARVFAEPAAEATRVLLGKVDWDA